MKRFSPTSIIRRHFRTLHKEGTTKPNFIEFSFFSIVPLALAVTIGQYYKLDGDTSRILVTVFAVFAGLFLNLLAMIYNIFDRSFQKRNIMENYGEDRKQKLHMFEEMIHNIAFGVLISVLVVIFSLTFVLFGAYDLVLASVLNYIIFTLLLIFIFTVLMVLKRLDNLIASEMKRKLIMFDEATIEENKLKKKSAKPRKIKSKSSSAKK